MASVAETMAKGFAILTACLFLSISTAGCMEDVQDWWNLEGDLALYVDGYGGPETYLSEFQTVEVAILFAQVKPSDGTKVVTQTINQVVDLVELNDAGPKKLFDLKVRAKQYDEVRLILNLTKAIKIDGTKPRVDATPPEGFYYVGSRLQSPSVTVDRAGATSFQFALTVNKHPSSGNVYFLQAWPTESKPI